MEILQDDDITVCPKSDGGGTGLAFSAATLVVDDDSLIGLTFGVPFTVIAGCR